LSWVLALLILAGIIVLSLGPEFIPDLPNAWNPLQHAAGYAALMWVLLNGLSARSALTRRRIALAALLVIALSAGLEVAQAAVNRDVEVTDLLANISGVVGAVLAWVLMRSVRQDRGP
jgi:VanZ family protein